MGTLIDFAEGRRRAVARRAHRAQVEVMAHLRWLPPLLWLKGTPVLCDWMPWTLRHDPLAATLFDEEETP